MRTVRRRVRWSRVLLVLIIFIMFIAAVAGAAFYIYKIAFNAVPASMHTVSAKEPTGRTNILLLGLDSGDETNADSPRRSDTMIVASINNEDGTVNLLSIPRDTRVIIPGQKNYDKINHAYFFGGPRLAAKTVEDFLQLPIHYYAAADWQTFVKVVDIVGGVNLYVERDMHYNDPYANFEISLQKGYQHLDGRKSGQYIRYRSDELGDIGRVQRQQRFIKALSSEVLNAGLIIKVPELASVAKEHVETDIPPGQALKLAYSLKGLNSGNLHIEMLPGNFVTHEGLSYWSPDTERIAQVVDRMFNSRSSEMSGIFDKNKRSN
ncbi:MAG: LCP family protein [Veillonellaceae bacterium]|jgi:LCP family protein required for cell wall assembly|nr:LCP family protein [Veillonellaceae bacterium]